MTKDPRDGGPAPEPLLEALLSRAVRSAKARLSARVLEPFAQLSFAQEGEDRVLCRLLAGRRGQPGFYVDVGAHHPTRFSNTYLLYTMGWRGINLDAMPGSMAAFAKKRPRDINLEIAVAEVEGELSYHAFNQPALNTFSEPLAETYRKVPGVRELSTTRIACRPLARVLEDALPPGTSVDLLSVDVEGLDLEVLRSNDWSRVRPDLVLVESLDAPDLAGLAGDPTVRFLAANGYAPIAKTVNTLFFRDRLDPLRGGA